MPTASMRDRRLTPWLAVAAVACLAALALPAPPAAAQGSTISLGRPIEADLIPPGVITADGTPQTLVFVVTDERGALANDVRFRGSSVDAGRLTEWAQAGPGLWTVVYTPPDNSQLRQATLKLKVKVGTQQAERSFPLTLQPSGVASFAFEATPPQLVLARDPNATLMFTVSGSDGGPLDGLDLGVVATLGTTQDVSGLGGGRYQARYVPPPGEIAPKVALLAVYDKAHPETAIGFFTIPLVGNITWTVNTGMAGVNVLMDVAGQRFGPFATDAGGNASVPILVPPGVSTATATVVMPDGTATPAQAIDLMVPPFQHIAMAPLARYLPGDGSTRFPVFFYVVDAVGQPDPAASVQLVASQGEITEPRPLGEGLYHATYTPPVVDVATPVTLTATVPGQAQDVVTQTVDVVPALPAALSFAADPATVSGDASVTLSAGVTPLPGSAGAHLDVAVYDATGALPVTAAAGGLGFGAVVSGNFDARHGYTAATTLPALAQPAETLIAWPVDEQVATNGSTTIVAMAVDRYGLPVQGIELRGTVLEGGGSVSGGGTTDASGRALFQFTAAPLAGLSLVQIGGGGTTYTCPLWQTQAPVDGFVFPVAGGAGQRAALERWAPLRSTIVLGGSAPTPVGALTAPVVSSGTNPWGAPVGDGGTAAAATADGGAGATDPPADPDAGAAATPPPDPEPDPPPEPAPVVTPPPDPTPTPTATATPGPASRIEVVAQPATLPRDGSSTSSVLVRVLDADGRMVPGEQIVLVASSGTLTNKVDNGDGSFSALLTAPAGGSESQVAVSASRLSGELASWATVTLTTPVGAAVSPGPPARARTPRAAAPAPGDRRYRTARVMLRYPLGGYRYDMAPGDCGGDPCPYFPDMDVVGPGGEGLVGVPSSIGVEGEVFPIEYVGATARFETYGFDTDFPINYSDGTRGTYGDQMFHILVGATGRLPLLRKTAVGPLDVLLHLGYHAQDVIVFHDAGDGGGEWEFENLWQHGFRIGVGVRFQLLPWLQVHGGWAGTVLAHGMSPHEVAAGATFRVWKGLTVDARYQLLSRNMKVTVGYGSDEQYANIHERTHALVLGAGWSF